VAAHAEMADRADPLSGGDDRDLISASMFAEFEFWASILKVSAIVCFLAVAVVSSSAAYTSARTWPRSATCGATRADSGQPRRARVVRAGPGHVRSPVRLLPDRTGRPPRDKDADREVPRPVKGVIFRIGVFLQRIHLLHGRVASDRRVRGGTSPFVTRVRSDGIRLDR